MFVGYIFSNIATYVVGLSSRLTEAGQCDYKASQ